jgi:hypothetical protein
MILTIGKSFEERALALETQHLKHRKDMSAWQTCFLYFPVQVCSKFEEHSNQWAFMQWAYRKKLNRGDRYKWIYILTDPTPTETKP